MKVDQSIFKAYDIRGIYPDQLDEELTYKIGRAYTSLLKKENPKKVLNLAVSYDMRKSSPSLKEKLIQGILDEGANVTDYGLSSTPTFYFIVAYKKYDGGIQVSASHNPKEFNGLKMVREKGVPISGESGIYEIRDKVLKNKFSKNNAAGKLSRGEKMEGVEVEVESKELKVDTAKIKPFKIVTDTGNAMAFLDIEAMFKNLPCKLTKLFSELDGTFPNHIADPLKSENLKWAKEEVIKTKADLAIVTDGDGDRYFFVDEKGQEIRQEILRGIMAQIALRDNPGSTVCYDIRPGRITKDMIEEAGGKAVVTRVGHSLIKEKMLQVDSPFGGESSGHYFYRFSFGTFEAPVVLVLKFLQFLSNQDKPLSEVIKPYKKYFHSGEINSDVEDKEGKIKEIAKKYSDGQISYLDGITVTYDDFWFNVRPSNTENKLRLNLEAVSKKKMEEKRDEVLNLIRS
jgi:phosphomannomutase